MNDVNINKIIQSYFNLYFKDHKYVGTKKFILLRRRRKFLRRIYVSNAEIKHTNNKAIITLFTVNREKKLLKKKYLIIKKKISKNLIKRYFLLYKSNINKIYEVLSKHKNEYAFSLRSVAYPYPSDQVYTQQAMPLFFFNKKNNRSCCSTDKISKRKFLQYKLEYLNQFITLKNLYLKKV